MLFQEQTTKQAENQISAALEERDDVWQQKMSQQEMAHQEIVATKVGSPSRAPDKKGY